MDDVSKVTITYPPNLRGLPMVYVVLKPGALDKIREYNTVWTDLQGYAEARVFYAPQYQTPDDKPDYRTTIHWEPDIKTDKTVRQR